MKNIFKTILSFFVIFTTMISGVKANDIDALKLLTEDYPPFNFSENNEIKGISVDALTEMFKKTGSKLTAKDVTLLPWANAYKQVQEENNTMLFVMTKSDARKDLFKWVGPVSKSRVVLFAKKGSGIKISSFEDVKKYTVGAIRDDVTEQLLVENGIAKDKIDLSSNAEAMAKKFNIGRFDLLSDAELVGKWRYKKAGFPTDELEVVFVMSESELHYALNKGVKDEVVSALQKALDELKADGSFDKIVDKYLK